MDSAEEVREYQEMDHSEVNRRFVDELLGAGSVGPKVIDLGTGPAAIPILLCESADELEIMAVDSSIEMLEVARVEIELAGRVGQIFLEHADAKSLAEFTAESADTVISNSLMHHLADPSLALASAIQLLKGGGRMFIRDLARPAEESELELLVEKHTAGESEFARQLFRQSLHAALTVEEIRHLCGGFGIPAERVQMTSDRHWTIDWTKPVVT